MQFPLPRDEAGFRALEPRCASAQSADSKRVTALLFGQSEASKEFFLLSSVYLKLPNLVRCALEAGADVNCRSAGTKLSAPALVLAAGFGHRRIVKQLLEAGADHRLTDNRETNALSAAAQCGHLDCIRLLDAGADANICNAFGTPLICAILVPRALPKALLPASNLHITNLDGLNSLYVCVLCANEECFELLLPLVSDVDVRTVRGRMQDEVPGTLKLGFNCSSLHMACQKGQHRMAKALLKRGADRMTREFSSMYAALSRGTRRTPGLRRPARGTARQVQADSRRGECDG